MPIRTVLVFMIVMHGVLVVLSSDTLKPIAVQVPRAGITVDGETNDWAAILPLQVNSSTNLFTGKGLPRDKWIGPADLSFSWRAAWDGDKLYFLIDVTDDRHVRPSQEQSFMNDCAELFIDPLNSRGKRVNPDGNLNGYELHFLSAESPMVFVNLPYETDKPQNRLFADKWAGKIAAAETPSGYVIEIELSIPGFHPEPNREIGLEVVVCDDDGEGRETQMLWTGTQSKFWYNMDNYGTLVLAE